jgi:hypothetical protein
MIATWLALALQLQAGTPPAVGAAPDEDSLRDLGRARAAQAGFEQERRHHLPWSNAGGGQQCDVRIGRYCWWHEDGRAALPAEPPEIARRRDELLEVLGALASRRPGDRWVVGMRVYYQIDNRQPARADSAARACRAGGWWCDALGAWAAGARGDALAADSGWAAALAAMPEPVRCAWSDITVLLAGDLRDRYAEMDCAARAAVERRYWMLSAPRLAARANEWRSEFYARRVLTTLLATAVTPHRTSWGRDAEELALRYGWPTAWSRTPPASATTFEPGILGHDPAPSVHFGPRAELLDSTVAATADVLDTGDRRATSRFAHHAIRRVAPVAAQLARFRRGDSTLVVAAWAAHDDSLLAAGITLGAILADGSVRAQAVDSQPAGRARLLVPGALRVAGVELSDSVHATFARARAIYPAVRDSTSVAISDLLLYRPDDRERQDLDAALALAIPGDRVSAGAPLGLYWEAYGADGAAAALETAVLVERIDRGFFRAARQRLGLADPDSPVQIRWNEAGPGSGGVTPRALSLDLSLLPPGRYRVSLSLTPATGAGVTASREVELR